MRVSLVKTLWTNLVAAVVSAIWTQSFPWGAPSLGKLPSGLFEAHAYQAYFVP
jgi:hypothetical protein